MKLQDWLQKFIFPAEAKNVDREFVRWGTRLAVLEMALSGTTTFTDMYYFEDTVAEVTKQAGLRGMLGETVIGFPAPDYKTPQASLAATEKFFKTIRQRSIDRARRGAARDLHRPQRCAQSRARFGEPLSEAAGDSSFRNQDRERRSARQAQE